MDKDEGRFVYDMSELQPLPGSAKPPAGWDDQTVEPYKPEAAEKEADE